MFLDGTFFNYFQRKTLARVLFGGPNASADDMLYCAHAPLAHHFSSVQEFIELRLQQRIVAYRRLPRATATARRHGYSCLYTFSYVTTLVTKLNSKFVKKYVAA